MSFPQTRLKGFTLAELLISLAILGVIATFSIPKILAAQQKSAYSSQAKEAAAMVAAAYQKYQLQAGPVTASFSLSSLTPYMNFVSVDTTSLVDDHPLVNVTFNCATNATCLKLHSGGTLFWASSVTMGGTTNSNAVYFLYDPDGVKGTTGVSDGPGKSVCFFLYYNGTITSRPYIKSPTISSDASRNPVANTDPSWFSWQ